MLLPSNTLRCPVAGLLAVLLGAAVGSASAESADGALWLLWQRHEAETNHASIANACEAFAARPEYQSLAPVAAVLGSWHRLKAGRTVEATALLQPLLSASGSPIEIACAEIARAWLTRVDALRLGHALRRHYVKKVAFPETLAQLLLPEGMPPVPLTDRWGRDWAYRLTGFETLPGLRDQKYRLSSPVLKDGTDLAVALARPYAGAIQCAPTRLVSSSGGQQTWEFAGPGDDKKRVVVSCGAKNGDIHFIYGGTAVIVLADRDYCRAILRPR